MLSDEILFLTVSELAKRIQSKALSPVDLTKAYLDRSEKLGSKLNAYARLTPEIALAEAAVVGRPDEMKGQSVVAFVTVKTGVDASDDLKAELRNHVGTHIGAIAKPDEVRFAEVLPKTRSGKIMRRLLKEIASGVPTTWGAKPYENQVFDYDATVIEHLRRVGAILIGKAAMIELAGGMNYRFASASLEGPAKNPWNTNCWTCGSSSGSGAIVAAGLAGFAIGTETWGSIVCPAAFCGVSGLRPTYGRVSRYGAMALSYSMDKIGPLARSAEDCAQIFADQPAGAIPVSRGQAAARHRHAVRWRQVRGYARIHRRFRRGH